MLLEQFLTRMYGERFAWEFSSEEKGEWYDLDDFKEYQVWDNVKRINWKMLAKYDKEYVSVYKIDKESVLDIFIDNSINLNFFEDKIKEYFNLIDILTKKFWIKKNIYYVETKKQLFGEKYLKLKKTNDFQVINVYNKKSYINEILNSQQYQTKHYKLVLSDFMFFDKKNTDNFVHTINKQFFSLLPIKKYLQNSSFPTLNGYYDKTLCKDLFDDYTQNISLLQNYGQVEIIENW